MHAFSLQLFASKSKSNSGCLTRSSEILCSISCSQLFQTEVLSTPRVEVGCPSVASTVDSLPCLFLLIRRIKLALESRPSVGGNAAAEGDACRVVIDNNEFEELLVRGKIAGHSANVRDFESDSDGDEESESGEHPKKRLKCSPESMTQCTQIILRGMIIRQGVDVAESDSGVGMRLVITVTENASPTICACPCDRVYSIAIEDSVLSAAVDPSVASLMK